MWTIEQVKTLIVYTAKRMIEQTNMNRLYKLCSPIDATYGIL